MKDVKGGKKRWKWHHQRATATIGHDNDDDSK
jgi:hypothetical protein